MRISNVRVLLLSAPIPPERRWKSDFGTNTKQDLAIVIVETDDGLTGYGEASGTPEVMKVLVEDLLGPQLVGEDPTRVEFLWEKMYSGSRLPLALPTTTGASIMSVSPGLVPAPASDLHQTGAVTSIDRLAEQAAAACQCGRSRLRRRSPQVGDGRTRPFS